MRLVLIRLILPLIIVATAANSFAQQKTTPKKPQFWASSFEQAQKVAKKEQRPILLHFYTSWCLPCQKMEREVLNSNLVAKELGKKVLAVKVNAEKRPDLARKYGIQIYPTDVFVDPNGRIIGNATGFRAERDYITLVSAVEQRFSKSLEIRQARKQAGNDIAQKGLSKIVNAAEEKVVAVGLEGYCPVTLKSNRTWTKGESEFAKVHKGFTYNFTSAANLKKFTESPSRYTPRLLGCDPVIMWESDRAVAGDTRYGAFFDGELYLFTSQENRKLFKVDPARYVRVRHVLNLDEIEVTARR